MEGKESTAKYPIWMLQVKQVGKRLLAELQAILRKRAESQFPKQ